MFIKYSPSDKNQQRMCAHSGKLISAKQKQKHKK
jgi:hypothetical protein